MSDTSWWGESNYWSQYWNPLWAYNGGQAASTRLGTPSQAHLACTCWVQECDGYKCVATCGYNIVANTSLHQHVWQGEVLLSSMPFMCLHMNGVKVCLTPSPVILSNLCSESQLMMFPWHPRGHYDVLAHHWPLECVMWTSWEHCAHSLIVCTCYACCLQHAIACTHY